jgi:hypothetical protein
MLSFKQFIIVNEAVSDVHRLDHGHKTPSNWGPGAKTYASNKTGTESGETNPLSKVDPRYPVRRKGVYAHEQLRDAARYAARNWIHHEKDGKHILTLPSSARNSGWEKTSVTHTTFSGRHFESLPGSGEHFSKPNSGLLPPKTTEKTTAGDVIKKSGLEIRYAPGDNLHSHAEELEKLRHHRIHGMEVGRNG